MAKQKITQNESDWWVEDAERVNRMSEAARQLGAVVEVNATAPKLNPNGSLADQGKAEEDVDIRVVANEFGLDEGELRDAYKSTKTPSDR